MGDNGQFHLVTAILEEEKFFDISLEELLRQHSWHRKFEVSSTAEIFDPEVGERVDVYLSLKVSGRFEYPISWDAALLMHHTRIDGFGFEDSYTGTDGKDHSGWHRHIWNARLSTAKGKSPVDCFESANVFQHFVTTALKEMKIVLNGRDDGSGNMFHS